MKAIMDSDCLIKLTKAGAKEAVTRSIEVHIPLLVKRETVDDAKRLGHQDALLIEANIASGAVQVKRERATRVMVAGLGKGENDVIAAYLAGRYDVVASDDSRFLRKLDAAGIPFLTPAACIIHAFESGVIAKEAAVELLRNLSRFVKLS